MVNLILLSAKAKNLCILRIATLLMFLKCNQLFVCLVVGTLGVFEIFVSCLAGTLLQHVRPKVLIIIIHASLKHIAVMTSTSNESKYDLFFKLLLKCPSDRLLKVIFKSLLKNNFPIFIISYICLWFLYFSYFIT